MSDASQRLHHEDRLSDVLSGLRSSDACHPSSLVPHEKKEKSGTGNGAGAGMAGVYRTPMSTFAMLDDQLDIFRPESGSVVLSTRSAEDFMHENDKIRGLNNNRTLLAFRCIALLIGSCFVLYVFALLLFCTSLYRKTIQPWIITGMDAYIQPYQRKEEVAGFVYLLCCGVLPTLIAFTLWQLCKGNKMMYASLQSETLSRFLRQKPRFSHPIRRRTASSADPSEATLAPPKSQLYIDATWGEIGFVVLILSVDMFIFVQVLLTEGISSLSSSAAVCRAIGKSCGYICLFTMLWLLLPMTKDSFWMEFFHLPYPLGTKLRRWLGVLALLFAVLHSVCHALSFYLKHEFISQLVPHFGAMYRDIPIQDSNGVNAFGELALLAMIVMGISSVPMVRKKFYALYLSLQQVLGSLVVLAVCVHFPQALWWLFPSLILFLTQKVVAGSHARYPIEIVDMAPLPNGMTRLLCKRSKDRQAFAAGQFIYLYASRISWFQWHPFYIASSPKAHEDTFKVYVQASGDWTESFFDLSKLAYATQEAPAIYADGFYGPSHPSYYEQYGCLVLIAEGIGATGVLAILEDLYFQARASRSARHDAVAEGGAEQQQNLDADEAEARQVWFLWVCKDVCLFKEFEELLLEIRAFDPTENHFRIRLFLTKTPTTQEIKYIPPAPCIFQCPDDENINEQEKPGKHARKDCCEHGHHHHQLVEVEEGHEDPGARPRPQNKSGLFGFTSRPFQVAIASPVLKILVALVVFTTTLALAVHVEWQDHQHGSGVFGGDAEEEVGMFRPMHRVACVIVILAGCCSAYLIIICEEISRFVRRRRRRAGESRFSSVRRSRRPTCGTECEPHAALSAIRTSTSTTTHWIRMTPQGDQDGCDIESGGRRSSSEASSEGRCVIDAEDANNRSALMATTSSSSNRGTNTSSSDTSGTDPDVLAKLNILSLRPDLDRFMEAVAKCYYAYAAETIGVFACGNPKFVTTSEAAVRAAGELDGRAPYRFHRLDFKV